MSKYNLLCSMYINYITIYAVLASYSDCFETQVRTTIDKIPTYDVYSSKVVTRNIRIMSKHTSINQVITFVGLEYGFSQPSLTRTHQRKATYTLSVKRPKTPSLILKKVIYLLLDSST